MTIHLRLLAGFGAVAFLAVALAWFNYRGVGVIVAHADEVIHGNGIDLALAQRETDHLAWAYKVRDYMRQYLVAGQASAEIGVELDHRACEFGKWLYGDGRQQAEALVPTIGPILQRLEASHRGLHEAASAIQSAAHEENGRWLVNELYDTRVATNLKMVQGLFHEVRQEIKNHLVTDEAMLAAARTTRTTVSGAAAFASVLAMLAGLCVFYGVAGLLVGIKHQQNAASGQVSAAAVEVSGASGKLTEGAADQASAAEEVSASLEEVTAMARLNADNAGQADLLMQETQRAIGGADRDMATLITSMREISVAGAV